VSLARSLLAPMARTQAALPPADTIAYREPFISAGTAAGPVISAETALFLTVVLACIQVVSDAITLMPLLTYQRLGSGRQQVDGAWQHQLLHEEPNPEMDAAMFWGDVSAHLCMDWNAFIGKTFDARGRVSALWPIRPDWVRVERKQGVKIFLVRDEFSVWSTYTQKEIIHARAGYSYDGLRSYSPIRLAAQQIGAGIAMERFMNEFWANGALPTAVLQTANELDDKRARQLANKFMRAYRGRRRGIAVLEQGLEVKPLSWSHVDAQFIEQKRELVETIARVWRVPLGKLMTQISGTAKTYRNQEQERDELYSDAVLPKAIRLEKAVGRDRDIFPPSLGLFCEFNADEVLRADSLTRAQVNRIRTGGAAWTTVDEIRAEDNKPPSPELAQKQLEQPTSDVGSVSASTP
jgi:HK97 family phage portal protein